MKRLNVDNTNAPQRYAELYFGPRRPEMRARPPVEALLLALVQRGVVLDIGCGIGQYIPSMHRAKVIGIDFSAEALVEAAERFPYASFMCLDFSDGLPYDDQTFDIVFCSEVIEHMENPTTLVAEIRRVLLPGGVAIVTTPYLDSIPVDEHLWTFDEADMRHLFSSFNDVGMFRYSGEGDLWEHFLIIARKP